jgi:hypothetical protein
MVFDDDEASSPSPDLLMDKIPQRSLPLPPKIRRIQSILASTSEEFSSDDESSISGDRLDVLDAPPVSTVTCPTTTMPWDRKNACSNKRKCIPAVAMDAFPTKKYSQFVYSASCATLERL